MVIVYLRKRTPEPLRSPVSFTPHLIHFYLCICHFAISVHTSGSVDFSFILVSSEMGLGRRYSPQQRIFIAVFCFLIFCLWQSGRLSRSCTYPRPETIPGPIKSHQHNYLPCRSLPGANDTVVIVKTGSTELQDRLPIHLTTTLRCYPNYLIFSDHEEYYQGEHIIDALDDVSTEVRENHIDFHLHRRLRQIGRKALAPEELNHGVASADAWTGHTDNPGWKLDKWKFLPMVKRTFEEFPNKKWYVFVEADTYILWASLLQFLAALNPNKPHYTGNQMAIGGDLFAHGGSGFVVSNPAMKIVVDHYNENKLGVETLTGNHWAGDCILGIAFRNAGVPFTFAWPTLQTDDPGQIPYLTPEGALAPDVKKRPWCYPTVSYHHTNSEMVEDLWKFEQQWIGSRDEVSTYNIHNTSNLIKIYLSIA